MYSSPYASPQVLRGNALGRVLSLLAMAAGFTAVGAFLAPVFGRAGFLISIIGTFGTIIALGFVKDRFPLNLVLLFAFATFEGIALGLVLDLYVASGMSDVVLAAASATGLVAMIAGGYGYTTKRDLSGLGGFLFVGLLALVGASIIGIFVHLTAFQLVISGGAAVLFTGFLIYDLNRIARAGEISQGDAVLMAVSVYIDLLNLFYALLRIMGALRR